MQKHLISFIAFLLITATASTSFAQNQKCPRGAVDCKGLCGWYTDKDLDKFCDYSNWSQGQLQKKQNSADSLAAVAKAATEKKHQDSLANQNANSKKGNKKILRDADPKQSNEALVPENTAKPSEVEVQPTIKPAEVQQGTTAPEKSKYDLILILFACSALYIFTFLLARRDVIKKVTHRKLWNALLLLTFLITGLIGLFLAIQLNYNFQLEWFANLLYWHVEFGIAMAGISIFHVLWHLKYWKNIFSRPGGRIKEG